jgi:cyclopropane-fatty-acyl-phospholipid synthase
MMKGVSKKEVDSQEYAAEPGSDASRLSTGVKSHRREPGMFHSRVFWFDRLLVTKMVDVVGNPPVRISLWDGVEATPPCDNPMAVMTYCDRSALLKTIVNPELHWGDLYCSGRVIFRGDLAKFMEAIYRGLRSKGKPGFVRRFFVWLGHRRIFNSFDKARENIHHHYDLGNDFYKLWLDTESMQYTCGYFPRDGMTLEEGQFAKLDHVCRKLNLKPGESVVEAGCGWGGLARFMAKHYGVSVKAYNISTEQVNYARQQAEAEGLSGQVEYVLDDYRNIEGEYNVFVSVGMLEHVATHDYEELGALIKRILKPSGRGLIHAIGRKVEGPMNAWIERRIFPGARPPALSQFMGIFEPNDLVVYDIENLRLHYSKTLALWAERFHAHSETIVDMMDDEFLKAWGLYLDGSIAAFNSGALQLFQVVFSHDFNNDLPRSRHYIYSHNPSGKAPLTAVPVATE